MLKRNIFYFVFIVLISFLSYQYNFFHVTSMRWFNEHQLDSESLVLDGILHERMTNSDEYFLGYYKREGNVNYALLTRELFKDKSISGPFIEYQSQYGLQGKFCSLLYNVGMENIEQLHLFPSLMMSLVVSILFLLIKRDFSLTHAYLFSFVLIFSPWVVVFARNLYWFAALWYLPFIITMYYSNKIFSYKKQYIGMFVALYFSYLLKFLCGYEYITTVVIASFLPIVYQGLNQNIRKKIIVKYLFLIGLVSIISFVSALVLNVNTINKDGNGWHQIYITAVKRLSNEVPREILIEAALGDKKGTQDLVDSLESDHLSVILKYFNFRDFLPWIGSSNITFSQDQKDTIRLIIGNSQYNNYEKFIELSKYVIESDLDKLSVIAIFSNRVLSPIIFILFILFYLYYFNNFNKNDKIFTLLLFCAPLSWYYIAKGHSYLHPDMNFILWYIPTLPYLLIILYSNYIKRKND